MIEQRNRISVAEILGLSKIVFRNIPETFFRKQTSFHTYIGSIQKKEINTISLAAELIRKKFDLWVPFIDQKNTMHSSRLNDLEDLIEGPFGILQPQDLIDSNVLHFDIIFVPGLAFDKKGNRIGYGKGYYDKFLSEVDESCLKIGLCFDFQLIDHVPADGHDIPVDWIICESDVIKINS